jgi:exopolysaccharide biosynthesis polyprenyl glycosylphosphotransferase
MRVVIGDVRKLTTWAPPALAAFVVVFPAHVPARRWTDWLLFAGAAVLLLLLRAVSDGLRQTGCFRERVLIVGTSPVVETLIAEIEARPDRRYSVIGVVDDLTGRPSTASVAFWLGSIDQLGDIIDATHPDRIVIALADRRRSVPMGPLLDSRVRGVPVEEAVNFFERVTGKLAIEALSPNSLILSDGFRHSDFAQSDVSMMFVGIVSLVSAAVGIVLLAPVFAAIACLIRLDSPGPIFFVQKRIGWNGRPFGLVKFRTMHAAGRTRSEWVKDNEDRITRVGKWLRRFRLDELPQFVNVLRGEMNLVGPRPHPVSNTQLFLDRIPYYALRGAVRPGITGWAQIQYGYANGLEEETEKMRYDLFYIKHRSLSLDLRILLKTIRMVVVDRHNHESVRKAPGPAAWSEPWGGPAARTASR